MLQLRDSCKQHRLSGYSIVTGLASAAHWARAAERGAGAQCEVLQRRAERSQRRCKSVSMVPAERRFTDVQSLQVGQRS